MIDEEEDLIELDPEGGESLKRVGLIACDIEIKDGDAGAPVLNEKDELVGMMYGGSKLAAGFIPIKMILDAFAVELA